MKAIDVSRRRFLSGSFSGRNTPLRPPWALLEREFVGRCTRCDACVGACAAGIIVREPGGFPRIDFARGGCTFCGDCRKACEPGALGNRAGAPWSAPWSVKAGIGAACIALKQVVCRSCGDACDGSAIRFQLRARGVAAPVLDIQACTGCGACHGACPVEAIAMRHTAAVATA